MKCLLLCLVSISCFALVVFFHYFLTVLHGLSKVKYNGLLAPECSTIPFDHRCHGALVSKGECRLDGSRAVLNHTPVEGALLVRR